VLARSILGYAPSNLVPAATAVATIVVFSRLLPPDEFGRYAVGQGLVLIGQALAFYGVQVSVTRFYARQAESGGVQRLLATAYACFALCAAATAALLALGIHVLAPEPRLAPTLWLALPVLVLRGLVMVNLAAHRGALRVARYNLVECGSNVAGFAVSLLLAGGCGLGAAGLMLGLLAGTCVGLLPDLKLVARSLGRPDRALLREMTSFGGPLVVCYALNSAQAYADRLFLERLAGASAVGLYQRVDEVGCQPWGSGSTVMTSVAASVPAATIRMPTTALAAVATNIRCAEAPATNSRGVPVPTRSRMISPRL
jgi:O-antigen/teichoic acid export membrane protein